MMEYGDVEGLYDGTSTMDLTGQAIMIDTGVLELRNDVTYIMDNAIVFDTGYTRQYGTPLAQWISDYPYDTTLQMNGGEVNGLYPKTATGDVVGLVIGGLQGSAENALNLDIDGVVFNNIIGLATGTGDRDSTLSFTSYAPSTVEIENSFIYHYRDMDFRQTLFSDSDYCIRLTGVDGATISGNTFANCPMAISFQDSAYISSSSTPHDVIGSDNVVIDGNNFVDTSGINVMGWADGDADNMVFTNNVLSCSTCTHMRFQDDTSFNPLIESNTFNGGDFGVWTSEMERVNINGNTFNNQADIAINIDEGDFNADGNTINNPGQYAIYAEALEQPTEQAIAVVAGVNTAYADAAGSFVSWDGASCYRFMPSPGCVSPDIYATNAPGQEMILRMHEGGVYPSELRMHVTQPDGTTIIWDPPSSDGAESWQDGSPNFILDQEGVHAFYLRDTYGDGPDGGGFEVVQSDAGTWGGAANSNPVQYWIPYTGGLTTVEPTSCYSVTGGWPCGYQSSYWNDKAYSNTADSVLIQNLGSEPVTYEITAGDMARTESTIVVT